VHGRNEEAQVLATNPRGLNGISGIKVVRHPRNVETLKVLERSTDRTPGVDSY
jgi:hypothetical protein